jgi:hypothetical protein
MANSTSANLKLTVQATGENSGTWGQITNTNLLILEQAIGGYSAITVNATTGATLTFSNGALSNGKDQVIKLTGTITGNIDVVIPDSVEKTYIIENGTSGAFTVTVKTTSGTGVTWAATDKGTKMVYSDGTNVVDTAFTDLSSDITPQLSGVLDTNGNDIIVDDAGAIEDDSNNPYIRFQKTASAVNYIDVTNQATGSGPAIDAVGSDSNIDLNISPKGIGRVVLGAGAIQQLAEKATIDTGAGLSGTFNFDVITQAVRLHTGNNTANWTLNIRGDGSNTLNSIMDIGESITVALISTNGGTPYYNSAVQIDSSSVTPVWQGGAAPTAGNASSKDAYTYTVIKTADATFTVLAAQTQFA